MARYSRILSSAKYYSAIDNYIKWITDASKKTTGGTGKPRPPSQNLYIQPFAAEGIFTATQFVKVTAAQPAWNTHKSKFTGYTKDVLGGTDKLLTFGRNFRAARVVIKTDISQTKTKKTSHITGMYYSNYGGTSVSIPFGQKTAGEAEAAAFLELQTEILLTLNLATSKVTHVRERA